MEQHHVCRSRLGPRDRPTSRVAFYSGYLLSRRITGDQLGRHEDNNYTVFVPTDAEAVEEVAAL